MPNIANAFNGFYRALVIDTKDPQLMGRVRVRIPDLMVDPDIDATGNYCDDGLWAHPANNYLGGRNLNDTSPIRCNFQDAAYQGSCLIPPMGSHVFVFFEKGDPNHPFYFGAAEYGQYIVPPENRLGPDYDKKWTLLKTHEGRTIIVSDDKYDERVEITGKKRQLTDAPFGDIDSVFKIDDNQSVILIDERKDNEKIFIKDYRGNYIKMIQHENSEVHGKVIEDQLHVYFHDDIHIDTPKNIYITAGENIHIRAGNDIYIHALHDMFIKAKNDLKEMARRINRYSETSDDRYAGTDINDKAANVINRQGVNEINDISVRCTRSALNMIADQSANKISYVSAATTNISSGGPIMIMGSKTITQTSCAPEPVVTKCRTAEMTPAAIPANPDKFRYETIEDNPVDFPKEYKSNLIPHQFYSDIAKESQSYSAIVGGSPIDPYIPPTRLSGGEVNNDLANSINNDINDRIQKIKMSQAEEIDASVVKAKNGTVKIIQSSTGESTGEIIPVSIYPSSKTSSEIIEEAIQESYEQLRNKDIAEEKYKELIKKEYQDIHDEIKKTIEDIKDLVEESKEEYKFKFIDSSINTNYTIFNTLVSNWKEYCTYEIIESNPKSTRYECDIIFEKWLFIIEYVQKTVENRWHSYLKDILPDEILSYTSYIINDILKSELIRYQENIKEHWNKEDVRANISSYLQYIADKQWGYSDYITAENHASQLLNDIVKNENNFTDFYFTSNYINNWKTQCELFYTRVNDKIQKEKLDVYYKNQLAIELRQAETGIRDLGTKYDLENSAEAVILTLKNKDVYDNLYSKFLEQYTEAKEIVTAEMAINSFHDIQDVFSETSDLITNVDLYPDKYFNDSKIAKCSNNTFEKFDKGITDEFLSKCPSIVNNPNFIKEYNDIWKKKLENPTDICNLVFKYVKQLFLDNHSNIMKECEPSCFSKEFDAYKKFYEKCYEEYICRDCIMKMYTHSVDPIGYIQIIDGWEQEYALIYTSDLNSICQNIKKYVQDNLLRDVIGAEESSFESESESESENIKLIAEDINKKVSDEKINSDTKAISEQVQEESRIDPKSNSPAAEETKQATEEAGEQVTEEVCSSIKKADEYLKNMDQPAKAIENTFSKLKIPNVGEAASNVGSAMGNYLKSNKFVSDMLDKKDSLPFANPNDLFAVAEKYCGSGEDSQNEYMKDMFDSVNTPMKDLCGLFSTSGSFMDGIGGAFELPSDSLMNNTLSANMLEIPSLFGKGMGGSTDSMLERCNSLISEMPPLSNVLCTSEELTNSLDVANELVNKFKGDVLDNLTDMISSPDEMAKKLADRLNTPFKVDVNLDNVNKLKGGASLSFLDKFKSMFDPILNVGDSISKLQDSLFGVFESFDPFASFGDGFGELKDSIGNIFSDGMLDGFKKLWDISGQDDLDEIFDIIKDSSYDELMSNKNEILSKCESLCDTQKKICTDPELVSSSIYLSDSPDGPTVLDSMVAKVEKEIVDSGIYPTPELMEKEISPLIEDSLQQVINSQKEIIENNIKLNHNQQDNKFSEFNPVKKLNSIPTSCSCGHEYLLFMKRKYINTILSWLGVNKVTHVSFSLVRDTDKLMSYKPQDRLMDTELIDQFNDMMNKYAKGEEPDKNNKWWNNLKFILDCCDIYGIDLIITIFDFNEVNAFITNRSETSDSSYTSANWDDNKQGRFLSDICQFLKYRHDDNGNIIYNLDKPERRYSKIILNLGYSNYINLSDKTNKLQPMYPSCGYIRPMVMHLAYQCNFSSNMMAITANEEGNVYYYNPYSEWKSYDDAVQHNLNEYEITARDYVDGCYNGNAQSVIYDTDGSAVVGGYCKFIIDCDRKSIPNMSVYDMSGRMNQPMYNSKSHPTVVEYYTDEGDIDCNIIPKIFNPAALNTIKYLYDDNYFTDTTVYKFDNDTGDIIL